MKGLGVILIGVGLALMVYIGINFIKESNRMSSPIPRDEGVKVIYVTPAP